jgi:hypothetical protein
MIEKSEMADPRFDKRKDAPDIIDGTPDNSGWIIAGIVAALVVGVFILYAVSGNGPQTTSKPAPETVGRSERAPAAPGSPTTPAPKVQ